MAISYKKNHANPANPPDPRPRPTPGCIVRTTAEVLLALLPEWEFAREHYALTGYGELVVRARADEDNRSVVHKPA